MEWQDTGIILRTQPFQDNGLIVTLLTEHHGKHKGFVRLSRRKLGNPLQIGSLTSTHWQARLADHLGNYRFDILDIPSCRLFTKPKHLQLLHIICTLLDLVLLEQDPCSILYGDLSTFLKALDTALAAAPLKEYALFEVSLLKQLGFGLHLTSCASTGQTHDLIYISPKSGHAVSQQAGDPFKDRLFPLPSFYLNPHEEASRDELYSSLQMTAFFIEKHVLTPHHKQLPQLRRDLRHF